jgi:hypothetical protein
MSAAALASAAHVRGAPVSPAPRANTAARSPRAAVRVVARRTLERVVGTSNNKLILPAASSTRVLNPGVLS